MNLECVEISRVSLGDAVWGGPPPVDSDWPAVCQTLYDGVDQGEVGVHVQHLACGNWRRKCAQEDRGAHEVAHEVEWEEKSWMLMLRRKHEGSRHEQNAKKRKDWWEVWAASPADATRI